MIAASYEGRVGAEPAEADTEMAEGIIAGELKRRGCTEMTLPEPQNGKAAKVKLAEWLRAETLRTVEWLA